MIINCRPSDPNRFIVNWIAIESIQGIRRSVKVKVEKEKEFNTFADANGFAMGMMKKGVFVYPLERR